MRKTIIAVALALSSTAAFAVSTCDTMPTKAKQEDCWSNLIGGYLAEADEYTFAVTESKKVPATVKRNVEKKRQAIPFDAQAQCRKDSMGYPENNCYIRIVQRFKDYTYEQTSKYGVPDMRMN
ncbi:hypothetical protein [Cupriavidus sp. AcVe19-6a]|uniref:hypothetical protein n=1 Tax=Cupriavidus sp. AcVe19-6a TaxID=2821358 RepID=UPI001AEA3478|nr:hypothetical protein [Cupriavidus sp. AcVe19-6a]MBP0635914.1 hypothetical protein [Cupriavidus sp. AcVe19-6a]